MRKPETPRRHPNAAEKRALKAAEVARYVKASGRKAQKGTEPNDRRALDLDLDKKLKRMAARKVDELMREDEDDA